MRATANADLQYGGEKGPLFFDCASPVEAVDAVIGGPETWLDDDILVDPRKKGLALDLLVVEDGEIVAGVDDIVDMTFYFSRRVRALMASVDALKDVRPLLGIDERIDVLREQLMNSVRRISSVHDQLKRVLGVQRSVSGNSTKSPESESSLSKLCDDILAVLISDMPFDDEIFGCLVTRLNEIVEQGSTPEDRRKLATSIAGKIFPYLVRKVKRLSVAVRILMSCRRVEGMDKESIVRVLCEKSRNFKNMVYWCIALIQPIAEFIAVNDDDVDPAIHDLLENYGWSDARLHEDPRWLGTVGG